MSQEAIKELWKNREYVENVSQSILKITEFLNKFEQQTRFKMGELNQKITALERKMEYVEAAVSSVEASKSG